MILGLALLAILSGSFFVVSGMKGLGLAVPPALGGTLILALGTTLPEFAITLHAALATSSAASIDNYKFLTFVSFPVAVLVGSSFANIFLVSGLSGILLKKPYRIGRFVYFRDLPFLFVTIIMIAVSAWWSASKGIEAEQKVWFGFALLALSLIYAAVTAFTGRGDLSEPEPSERAPDRVVSLFGLLVGALALGLGVYVLSVEIPGVIEAITGTTVDPKAFPIRDDNLSIYTRFGLLVVGVGVALPEIALIIVARLRGETDNVAANLVSATIFNLTLVLGLGIVLSGGRLFDGVDWRIFNADFGALLIGAGILGYCLHSERQLSAGEGFVLLLLYGGYWAARFVGLLPL